MQMCVIQAFSDVFKIFCDIGNQVIIFVIKLCKVRYLSFWKDLELAVLEYFFREM